MWLFRATSSSTFITTDVQSSYILSSFNRQTAFFLLVDPMDKMHKDPFTIDMGAPRHAQYMHTWSMEETSRRSILGRHQTFLKKDLRSIRCDRTLSSKFLHVSHREHGSFEVFSLHIQHGRNINTRCIGSISNLLNRKDLRSIRCDRTLSSFTTHSQLIVFRKLSGWTLEKLFTRKYMRHLGSLHG